MDDLAQKKCIPCTAGTHPLIGDELASWQQKLGRNWNIVQEHHLEKEYKFKNFQQALEFTCDIGRVAEAEGHHPEITLTWGKVIIKVWTHKIDGLSESDFILAAKCDQCYAIRKSQ
jgi:4a-hydroxytetrahydrobiopterin dehydratase